MAEENYEDQLKAASAAAYEHSREIAAKNKILALLAKLYDISIQSLSPQQLAETITKEVQKEFDFERAGVLLYDEVSDVLSSLAFAETERFRAACAGAEEFFSAVRIAPATKNPFFGKVIKEETEVNSEDLQAVWGSEVATDVLAKLQTDGHVRTLLSYPLMTGDRVMGVFTIALNRTVADLVDYEKQSIANIVTVTAVALDKALIYEELQHTNERQETLIHFIGHEVKGFLTKDAGTFAALVDGDFGALPQELKPLVENALEQSRNGAESVATILKASNLKKGTVTYEKKPLDLKELVATAVEKAKPTAEHKGLTISFAAEGESFSMLGDAPQLSDHVLRNLIDNAVNYTPTGSIAVSLKNDGKKLIFAVKDSGVGITDEDKKRLFTEGGHGAESQKINVHSTGYGLYIAKQITEAHAGTIRAESEGAGKGSTFIAEFPVDNTAQPVAPATVAAPSVPAQA
jgi:K+-sensing histidine kinase KdpD